MNVKKEITPEQDATLEVEIPLEETGQKFSAAMQKFQRNAVVPGFRPGKVPMNLVKQRWGRAIYTEVAEELAREYLVKALDEEKLAIGGRVNINLLQYGEDTPFKFQASFPLQPVVKLSVYKGLRLTVSDAQVTDEDVDAQLEALRHKHAELKEVDTPAPANARLKVRIQEVDRSGLPLIGRTVEEVEVELGADRLGIGSDEQLLGVKRGDHRLIRVKHDQTDLNLPTHIIRPDQVNQRTDAPAANTTLAVDILAVMTPDLPVVDEQFAKLVEPNLASVEQLRQHVRLNLMDFVAFNAHRQLDRLISDRLVEENPFPIARGVVETTLEEIAAGMNIEGEEKKRFIEEHFAEAEKDLRWVRLREEIAKQEGLEVGDGEVQEEIQRIAELTGESQEKVADKYADADTRERLRRRILESRVVELVAREAVIDRRPMSLREFIRFIAADNK